MSERDADKCTCCDGRRAVMDANGELRPCSRCNDVAFIQWADARRPVRVGADIACGASGKAEKR